MPTATRKPAADEGTVNLVDELPVRIVILQRGWVLIGRYEVISELEHRLHHAAVIRYWGTTRGLGELTSGPLSGTQLDPCGTARFHPMTVVFALDAEEQGWASKLR